MNVIISTNVHFSSRRPESIPTSSGGDMERQKKGNPGVSGESFLIAWWKLLFIDLKDLFQAVWNDELKTLQKWKQTRLVCSVF